MTTYVNIHTYHPGKGVRILNLTPDTLSPFPETLCEGEKNISYSVGIHPIQLSLENWYHTWQKVTTIASKSSVIAIGECGLDRRSKVPINVQQEILSMHLFLAEKRHIQLIIRCTQTYPEFIAWVKKESPSIPCIIHGFNDNIHILQQLLKRNFYISLDTKLLRENSNASQALTRIPLTSLFLENDTQHIDIEQLYTTVARRLNMELSHLRATLWKNYTRIFLKL